MTLELSEVGRALQMLLSSQGHGDDVEVAHLRRVFGGNARMAWTFWLENGTARREAIALGQVEKGQLDSDIGQEVAVLQRLVGQHPELPVPAPLGADVDGRVMGFPCAVYERLPGTASATTFLNETDAAVGHHLTVQLAAAAAALHADVGRLGAVTGIVETSSGVSELEQWRRRYRDNRAEAEPVLGWIFDWLEENLPRPERPCLVHGDLRPGNFLFEGGRLTGLLDWEMCHLGHPAEDIAWLYRSFWSPARYCELAEFLEHYHAAGGASLSCSEMHPYQVFAEAKFATISLQASHVFHSGRSANLRHADRYAVAADAIWRAWKLITSEPRP